MIMTRLLSLLKNDVFKIIASLCFFVSAMVFDAFDFSAISFSFYIAALIISGWQVFFDAVRGILRRDLLDEKFLMSVASVGAMIVGEWSEGCAVMIFFLIGETFEAHAVRRSKNSIRALMDICPDEAVVLVDGVETVVEADEVEVGSIIIIRPGERVPIDCIVVSGNSDVDTSAMTGESVPRSVAEGDVLDSGVVVINGLLTCKTLREVEESAAARVLELVETANENKSKEEAFITKFSRYYTPIVVSAAILLAIIPPLLGITTFDDSIYRALIFLVISCPCAIVISVPMAFFGGIGGAASRGILYKGGHVFSKIANTEAACFDKTGTLTSGKFSISSIDTFGMEKEEVLSLAASCEYASNHPIAECIKKASSGSIVPEHAEEKSGMGVVAKVEGRDVAVGNFALMQSSAVDVSAVLKSEKGILVSIDGVLRGVIRVSDTVKDEANSAIKALRRLGVKKTVMLSGDRFERAESVSRAVGIDLTCAELSPEEKYKKLESIIGDTGKSTMYVGDGINDAPALALSDIGVSMGSIGQDSAIEASDMVIMSDNLMKIPEAILIARKTLNISKQNIVFALGAKGIILILGALGIANMWLAVFADVGVAVIAILNSMRALKAPRLKDTEG